MSHLAPAGSPKLLLPVSTLTAKNVIGQSGVQIPNVFLCPRYLMDLCNKYNRFRNSSAWHARSEQSLAFFLPQQSCILYLSVSVSNIGLTGWKSHTATLTHGHTHADRLKDWLRKHLWWFQDLWDFPALRCSKTGPPERITQPENWKEKTKTEKTAPVSTASCQHWRPDGWKTQ